MQCVRANHRTLAKQVQEWDKQIANTLGKESRFRLYCGSRSRPSYIDGDGQFRAMASQPLNLSEVDYYQELKYTHINMAVSYLKMHRDDYAHQIRFILHHGNDSVGYACDLEHVRENLRTDPAYLTHISEEIARGMVSYFG